MLGKPAVWIHSAITFIKNATVNMGTSPIRASESLSNRNNNSNDILATLFLEINELIYDKYFAQILACNTYSIHNEWDE